MRSSRVAAFHRSLEAGLRGACNSLLDADGAEGEEQGQFHSCDNEVAKCVRSEKADTKKFDKIV